MGKCDKAGGEGGPSLGLSGRQQVWPSQGQSSLELGVKSTRHTCVQVSQAG